MVVMEARSATMPNLMTAVGQTKTAGLGDGVDAPYGIYVPRWWC